MNHEDTKARRTESLNRLSSCLGVFVVHSFAFVALLLASGPLAGAEAGLQRYLVSLKLGDNMAQIEQVYPPTRQWSKFKEPGGKVVRYTVDRGFAKWFPVKVSTVRLGMRFGRLVHIQVVYDRDHSREKPLNELVVDLSLLYGEPRREGESYFWSDSNTVLCASHAEILGATGDSKEFRTSLELMERSYFEPLE